MKYELYQYQTTGNHWPNGCYDDLYVINVWSTETGLTVHEFVSRAGWAEVRRLYLEWVKAGCPLSTPEKT